MPITDNFAHPVSSWYGGLMVSMKNRLDTIQRKMVRFVRGMDFRAHVGNSELFQMSWLSIPDRITYFRMIHLFKIRHKMAPDYLLSCFKPVSQSHSHNTRGSGDNFQLSHDLARSQSSFSFLAAKEWNALPHDLKNVTVLRVFKKRLKLYLFSRYD